MGGAFRDVQLEVDSTLDVLDDVQRVSEGVCRQVGLDDDALHWTSMAVRECVINAIIHGNHSDPSKRVAVHFSVEEHGGHRDLVVTIRDQGEGFEPSDIGDPLAPENILSTSGRGVFLVRKFMDELTFQKTPEGGTQVRMVKHL
jgi:serine/threonine-protein kinase RsbW